MTPSHRLRLLLLPVLAVLAVPASAAAKGPTAHASYVPGEVVVRYQRSADRAARTSLTPARSMGRFARARDMRESSEGSAAGNWGRTGLETAVPEG